MDQKTVDRLEREIEQAIAGVVTRLGLKKLPFLPSHQTMRSGVTIVLRGIAMSFVKCSVDGCNQKLQPILKVDPRDRDTWVYRECDVCLKPACEKHSAEVEGRIICDRCRREAEAQQRSSGLIDLGFAQRPDQE